MARDAAEALLKVFRQAGYKRIEPPILQPSTIFIELSGEDIRRRLFLTQDAGGEELCLRPEYTIPVCRAHLEAGAKKGAYAYAGPVFRQRLGTSSEFVQSGIESIGRQDRDAADADILALASQGAQALGLETFTIRIGDMGLLSALLEALNLSHAVRRRVARSIASGKPLDVSASDTDHTYAGLLAAIEGQDQRAAKAFVEDVLSIAGIAQVGGRSPGEIAERFLAKAGRQGDGLSGEARAILDRFLAISGDPDSAAAALRALADDARLDLTAPLDAFEARTGFIAAQGLDVANLVYAAGFARNLDYYTGFIFEMTQGDDPKPIAGGGRYDGLLSHLGASQSVPAVGCAFWLDRINAGAA